MVPPIQGLSPGLLARLVGTRCHQAVEGCLQGLLVGKLGSCTDSGYSSDRVSVCTCGTVVAASLPGGWDGIYVYFCSLQLWKPEQDSVSKTETESAPPLVSSPSS